MGKKLKVVFITIVILILVELNLYIFIKHYKETVIEKELLEEEIDEFGEEKEEFIYSNTVNTEEEDKNLLIEHYVYETEANRVQSYYGKFLLNIKMQKYAEAYSLLNDKFRNNYFSTLEAFKDYAIKTYPTNSVVKYGRIERQGELYILKATVSDLFDTEFQKFEQRVVVREIEPGEFKISFQVDVTPVSDEEEEDNNQETEDSDTITYE